jgi:hypothetical protein
MGLNCLVSASVLAFAARAQARSAEDQLKPSFSILLSAITYFIALSGGSVFNGFKERQRRFFNRSGCGR